jgi:hypothetical protein
VITAIFLLVVVFFYNLVFNISIFLKLCSVVANKKTVPLKTGATTVLYLDFDAEESVLQTGNVQYIILKPTIAVSYELSLTQRIKGNNIDAINSALVSGATVSAIKTDTIEALLEGSAISDEEGNVTFLYRQVPLY